MTANLTTGRMFRFGASRLILAAFTAVVAAATVSASEPAAREQAPAELAAPRPPQLGHGVPLRVEAARLSRPLVQPVRTEGGAVVAQIDAQAFTELKSLARPVLLESFPLEMNHRVTLEVERFRVAQPDARFVIGRGHGNDVPLDFDPESVVLLRGRIAGELHSHVYLAISERGSNGRIESSMGTYAVTSRGSGGIELAPGQMVVFRALTAGPNPPLCSHVEEGDHREQHGDGGGESVAPPIRNLRQVQLAIETDHHFYLVFNNAQAAADYVVQMYGACSDIFMRDINVRLDLTFVRIWSTNTVPFTSSLASFRSYWNANMQSVKRDVAQMFSGRGDLPGGVAYLNALCGSNGYSFCGNVVGHFAGVDQSSVYNYDILVAAHELGHNFGSQHTDVYGIDNCNQPTTVPRRGTIMSYCSQTVSGGASVWDTRFHKIPQNAMRNHVYNAPCVVFDCNQNGVADNLDIASGTSQDVNGNGIPDECEDCNGNGVLDSIDIANGTSLDLNGNGIPDECEPDCNGNGIPDDLDILSGFSQDVHGNNIPDECEPDLDGNGVSDYNQIMANMTLDRNRNIVLDAYEDCDGDGIPDLVALDGAWDAWAASNVQNATRQYHAVTGVHMRTSAAGFVSNAYDLIVVPSGSGGGGQGATVRRVLVSSIGGNKIVEFNDLGNYVGDLVPTGGGGLSSPAGMVVSPRNTLLVASTSNHRVIEYNLTTGAFIRNFVAAGAGGLSQPLALAFGPDGNLYVSSASNQIYRYNGSSGAFISIFVPTAGNGGLNGPRGMVFKPDGNLLVTSFGTNNVREYNGATGAYIKVWSNIGLAFQGPWCIRIAPNGHIHVSASLVTESHVTKADLHEFNINNGNWVRGYVLGADAGLIGATGFDYLPGHATDCNMNQVPDNCDILSGNSLDLNHNGIPDECEGPLCLADISPPGGDDVVNVNDLLAVINAWGPCAAPPPPCFADISPPGGDGVVNVNDLLAVINAWGPCR